MRRDLNFPSGVDISQEEDSIANVSPSLDSRIPNTLINCQKVCNRSNAMPCYHLQYLCAAICQAA